MIKRFSVDSESAVPIYQQLVDEIRIAIKKGDAPAGTQLPTVLQMAEAMGLARGTIKRAYDELELMGLVEKVQGRGTFVCYQKRTPESRKEQADHRDGSECAVCKNENQASADEHSECCRKRWENGWRNQ